ncbi:MAG: cytochrome c [Caulobacter sp.]
MIGRNLISKGLLPGVLLVLAAAVVAAPGRPTLAQTPAPAVADPAALGLVIADRDCSSCHAIGREGESPLEGAPRWRDLHQRFDVGDLAESLAEGIVVGHEAMPIKAYEPADLQALIAYLKSLETPGSAPK